MLINLSFLNLSALQYTVVSKNVVYVSDISAVNLIVARCLSACSMNLAISSPLTFHIETNVIHELFPNERFCVASAKDISFYFCHEDVGKSYRHFRVHSRAMGL